MQPSRSRDARTSSDREQAARAAVRLEPDEVRHERGGPSGGSTNQIGFGQARNGERTTVFSTRSNISGLWTKPVPDPMSVRGWPGNAPHGVIPRPYPIADQWLSDTVP